MLNSHIFPFLWMRGESEEILRNEMAKIHEAGIGAVCLEARPHPDFAGPGWWHDVDIIIEEAKKYDMQIFILDDAHFPTGMANGGMKKQPQLCRRFLVSQFVDVTGPLPFCELDVDLLMTRQITWMDLGKPVNKPLCEETRLLSCTLAKIADHDTVDGLPLDVTDHVKGGRLVLDIPAGTYRINVNFISTDFGGNLDYINYIDKDSVHVLIDEVYEKHYERYGSLFGTTIAGFFSDEPGFYNITDFKADNKIGNNMPLPWSAELETMLRQRLGASFACSLPLLFAPEKRDLQQNVRYAYMDIVSGLYSKNFSSQLGSWCKDHGVLYVGHVVEDNNAHKRLGAGAGHYFRAMAGQDIAGIDNIGYQIMPGNDVATRHTGFSDLDPDFYHYQIGKMGASEAAIDPKKKGRLLCENFGAYGWRLGVRDMKWLVDFLVCQGVNYFVPHAFSMAEYPDADCPPHFYARGNNPEYPFFCDLMRYTSRLCSLFDGGQGVPDVGVLYEAQSDWAGNAMDGAVIGKTLLSSQIDFLFLPDEVFGLTSYYGTRVEQADKETQRSVRLSAENGSAAAADASAYQGEDRIRLQAGSACQGRKQAILSVNGRRMKALIIPAVDYLPEQTARFIAAYPELPVLYLEHFPVGICGDVPDEKELLRAATQDRRCVPVAGLVRTLYGLGCGIGGRTDAPAKNLRVYHYRKDNRDLLFFQNVSLSETVCVSYQLPADGKWMQYDAMTDTRTAFSVQEGKAALVIPPYGSVVLISADDIGGDDISGHDLSRGGMSEDDISGHNLSEGGISGDDIFTHNLFEHNIAGDDMEKMTKEEGQTEGISGREITSDKAVQKDAAQEEAPTFLPLQDFTVTLEEIGGKKEKLEHFDLQPISLRYPDFAGTIQYEASFHLEALPRKACFQAEHVFECMALSVNGVKLAHVITPPYQADITRALHTGDNTITITVATTPLRNANTRPGIFGAERTILEPTGMFGHVRIRLISSE